MAKRKKRVFVKRVRGPRINDQITAENLRVVIEGKGSELMERSKALSLAAEMEMDLVEVSADQDPPICKIINFGKWKYEQQKRKKEQSKNQHVIQIKEIKLRPKIGEHDYEIKLNKAVSFLEKGNKVKVSLRFRGREMAHPELGMKLMDKMVKDLKEHSAVETPPKAEGRQLIMVMAPLASKKKKTKPEDEKKEVDSIEDSRQAVESQ